MTPPPSSLKSRNSTSLKVFRRYIHYDKDQSVLDVSNIISMECYLGWLTAKRSPPCDVEIRKYVRTLCSHLTGIDGRVPFEPQEERAILVLLRKREPWPCLPSHLHSLTQGFRSKGYHEKQEMYVHKQQLVFVPQSLPVLLNEQVSRALSPQDLEFICRFSVSLQQNYVMTNVSMEQWQHLNQIVRYTILAKTRKCCLTLKDTATNLAKRICNMFSHKDASMLVWVLDLTASEYVDMLLAQNALSKLVLGDLVGNAKFRIMHEQDTLRVLLMGLVVHILPGKFFYNTKQRVHCSDSRDREMDLGYYCDPETMLMVVCGKPSLSS